VKYKAIILEVRKLSYSKELLIKENDCLINITTGIHQLHLFRAGTAAAGQ